MCNRKRSLLCAFVIIGILISFSFRDNGANAYTDYYNERLEAFTRNEAALIDVIAQADLHTAGGVATVKSRIQQTRNSFKGMDFWLRYLEPTVYKKINGPLPVEWETEVFEKFEKPYKREGAGLTLAAQYLDEAHPDKQVLAGLIRQSMDALQVYRADSITKHLSTPDHFFLCNRLFLLNLAAIYTTGFECPDTAQIIPELRIMLHDTKNLYAVFNRSFTATSLVADYIALFDKAIAFADAQPANYSSFDHFLFIRDYVNPLFRLNQQMIRDYHVVSRSMADYSLNKQANSIFRKDIYNGQNTKGVFLRVADTAVLAMLQDLGKQLFFDPVLSGNNQRSCASCHKPDMYFADTATSTSLQYNGKDFLARNTPSLLNAQYNHLVMLDGKHFTLQQQVKAVITNPQEMGATEQDVMAKIMSCKKYSRLLRQLVKYTPQEPQVSFEHIAAALTYYYAKFSDYYSPFDEAMNNTGSVPAGVQRGFNIFMSKAQCATCHFVPQFNGVKPPYVGSEFEVLGVPAQKDYRQLSADKGRYDVNPADETLNAFRTGTVRNATRTMPYMHNGVFHTLAEVIDFYDAGGGAGHGLIVSNQTLSADSLHLSATDKSMLLQFIGALDEHPVTETVPAMLPSSKNKTLNSRKPGGTY